MHSAENITQQEVLSNEDDFNAHSLGKYLSALMPFMSKKAVKMLLLEDCFGWKILVHLQTNKLFLVMWINA